jgi:glycosyltransferase involved in cell wall biosynthesis
LDKHLHIVALDIPFPADYGGVIDIFYSIKALHKIGVAIHLHCFTKGRTEQTELLKYCSTVNYYPRKTGLSAVSFKMPYIVNSRKSKALIANLKKDNYPVLLEGIHCSYYLHTGELNNRRVMLRLHNTEFEYYKQLAKNERNIFKKLYFNIESSLLKQYEKSIASKAPLYAMSQTDIEIYKQLFGAADIHFLPAFHPFTLAVGKEGKGCYCLYHGNLSVNENEAAVTWLLQNVFNTIEIPFVIAGKNPSDKLVELAHQFKHTCIVANPGDNELQDMIAKAQLHILPSFNTTGIKLKLLNALFNGRHCLVNAAGVNGSGLEKLCHIATDAASFKTEITRLYQFPFTEQEKEIRQGLLLGLYSNEENVRQLTINNEQ